MEQLLVIVVGLAILWFAFKVLTGIIRLVVSLVVVAAVLYVLVTMVLPALG